MSMPTLPLTSYARKMNGLISVTGSNDRDRFDFDEPVGLGQRGHCDESGRGALLAEELLAHRDQLRSVTDVRQICVDLDDGSHGAASRLDLRLDRPKYFPRLGRDVAAVGGLPFRVV